ncbi:MAG: acyl-CoA dehydrogenase family protein, partial [Firmicutes bacterium]|nr:acyl-CoA dehydrogenase family protein [Bacillota bacterium]
MNFNLTKEQEAVRKMVRKFAANEVEPIAAECDREHRFPVETVEKMAKYGIMGIPYPEEYEGAGGDHVSYAIAVEELSRV